jgi:archaellum component FlaC
MPDINLVHNDTTRLITFVVRIGKLKPSKDGVTVDNRPRFRMQLLPGTNKVDSKVLQAVRDNHKAIFNRYVDEGSLLITKDAIKRAEKKDEPEANELDKKVKAVLMQAEKKSKKALTVIENNLKEVEASRDELAEAVDAKDAKIAELEAQLAGGGSKAKK